MHVPLLRALDPYARGHAVARKEKPKARSFEAFLVASVLDKPEIRRRFPNDGREASAPGDDEPEAHDATQIHESTQIPDSHAPIFGRDECASDDDAPLPEDAYDAQDLCAMLGRPSRSRD